MEKIDWDEAPEGATHFTPACDAEGTNAVFWRVIEGSVVNAWAVFKSGDLNEISINRLLDLSRPDILARPSLAWSGEGLPPVGVECEANFVGNWVKFELRYYGEAFVVFKTAFEVQRKRHDFDTCGVKFRPIRTPDQIAADEREAAIAEMVKLVADGQDYSVQFETLTPTAEYVKDACIKLYKAGYRKP